VVALHYVDRKAGTVIASSEDGDDAGAAVTGQEWFDENLLFGDQVYTTPTYEVDGQRRVAYVAATPLREYVVMEIDLGSVVSDFRQPTTGSFTAIVEADGTLGASDRPSVAGERYGEGLQAAALFGEEQSVGHMPSVSFQFADGGDASAEYFVAYAPVPSEDWYVAVHVPLSEAYAPLGDDRAKPVAHHRRRSRGLGLLGVTLGRGTVIELNRLTGKARERSNRAISMSRSTPTAATNSATCTGRSRRCATRWAIRSSRPKHSGSAPRRRKPRAKRSRDSGNACGGLRATMAACADGDLTARLDANADDPAALREIADGFNDAMDELEVAIARVDRFAEEVTNKKARRSRTAPTRWPRRVRRRARRSTRSPRAHNGRVAN